MKPFTKTLLSLTLLAVVDAVIPVPITAGILIHVLLRKPAWFRELVGEIYSR